MNHLGAGSRSSRSLYGKIFNVAHEQIGFDSQQSLEPIIPAAKRTYTVQSVSSPQERFLEYEKVKLGDVSTPNPAHTFGRSLEAPKEAIRKGVLAKLLQTSPSSRCRRRHRSCRSAELSERVLDGFGRPPR